MSKKKNTLEQPEATTTRTQESEAGLFVAKNGNQWINEAKQRPIPKMLFSEFWFESETCILFATANVGKSILAVQIADSISKGEAIKGFKLEVEQMPVLYFDFELSDKQFEKRYSLDYTDHYIWNKNFIRVELNPDTLLDLAESMIIEIEKLIIASDVKILIIDNITYLSNETDKSKNAISLMKKLKELKKKYDLSLLVLAHTPKRDNTKGLDKNDLGGSMMLMNFCDSSFAIGESQKDFSLRYIKQIKERNTSKIFHAENVCLCKIEQTYNFLKFVYIDNVSEKQHLKDYSKVDVNDKMNEAVKLHSEGLSNTSIAYQMGVNEKTIRNWLSKKLVQ